MKKFCLLVAMFTALAGLAGAGEDYPLGPDSQRQPGVPQGTVTHYTWTSKIFPGTVRDYWVYVPAQYVAEKPACVMVFEDGNGYISEDGRARIPIVFDNLIAKHDMPVTIAILIDPGVLKALAPGQQDRINRSFEYDGLSDRYARFLLDEILPEVGKHYNLSGDPNDRAISGLSSGGICSFTVAWTHPEAFHRVLSNIGSFTDLRGGDIYPALIRKTEPKPLRVFLQDGSHDLNIYAGDWWLANQSMASALTFAGYDAKFVTGDKDHDMIQGGAIMPDALRWLWRDYPQPIAKPTIHPLGNRQVGFVDMAPDWELVSSATQAPAEIKVDLKAGDISPLKDVSGIAVDQQGNVFTSNSSWQSIYRIGVDGHASTFAENSEGARGLAFGPDGRLYGCDNKGIVSYAAGGNRSVRLHDVFCGDLAFTRGGGLYFTYSTSGIVGYLPPGNSNHLGHNPNAQSEGVDTPRADGICLSPDQSMFYVTDASGKWVWSYQIQSAGSLAHGEPYFRMETLDESSESGASGVAVDGQGLLFVATVLGIQVCDEQGRVAAIINRPEQADPSLGPISKVAFGGTDHQYLYAVVGNKVFRRHLVRRSGP
ncbi:MAG: SMP-30/gluconolactonase/LRE family protein [Terriglobia bacterium]|jgi:enterochelin esterase-like enzyme/sugar lactone lactonase YvrE